MDVEYKKDLRHNYMIITDNDGIKSEPYCIKLLENQVINGVLSVEHRRMDDKLLFYYDITAKQSMNNLLEKYMLSYDKVQLICLNILNTLDLAYEHLLPEDDFILMPEYIYMDISTYSPSLCFFTGYKKNIKEQMVCLLEYLMNRIDYNDKDAVLLIYQLYAVSREEGFTFDHLREVLKGERLKEEVPSDKKEVLFQKEKRNSKFQQEEINRSELEAGKKEKPSDWFMEEPIMMEKIEGETEIMFFPVKTYLLTGVCILGGMIVVIISCLSKILYNSFGNRIDYGKLFALTLILFCVEGYLLKIIWDKKNKISKMVKTKEYIDPRQEYSHQKNGERLAENTDTLKNLQVANRQSCSKEYNDKKIINQGKKELKIEKYTDPEADNNPTCLLNAANTDVNSVKLVLKAVDESNYKDIPINSYPFFIGKLKKNVDYCLEKDVISRFHAKITKEGEEYYLTDLNSTNGTFLNNEALLTYQKKQISIGDELAFANIKYLFLQV